MCLRMAISKNINDERMTYSDDALRVETDQHHTFTAEPEQSSDEKIENFAKEVTHFRRVRLLSFFGFGLCSL